MSESTRDAAARELIAVIDDTSIPWSHPATVASIQALGRTGSNLAVPKLRAIVEDSSIAWSNPATVAALKALGDAGLTSH